MYKNDVIESIEGNLQEKLELFAQYEEITTIMLNADSEKLLELIAKRKELVSDIDVLSRALTECYEQDDKLQMMKRSVSNELNWADCPKELGELFRLGQNMQTIISRILRIEIQVEMHIETQKEFILEQIKKQNTNTNTKASKYYQTAKLFESQAGYFRGAY